jgi:hypothetical protein
MTVVIVRLDLDRYDALTISRLVRDRVITIGEATEAKCIKDMSDLHRLLWIRQVKDLMRTDIKEAI